MILSIMSGDSSVSGFRFEAAIFIDENGSHQTERTETLSDDIRLDITVVVLACPNESTIGLHSIGDHIIDETVLIPKPSLVESLLVILVKDLLENVLESSIILLHNGILCAHVAWVLPFNGVFE